MNTFGRRMIFTDEDVINESNIEKVISDAMKIHRENALEIEHLRKYAKGDQPILNRVKKTREDILNKVVVNTAAEVLDFKLSYIFSAPIDIVRPSGSESTIDISAFQRMMAEQRKDDIDQEIALSACTGGLGYRGVLNNPNTDEESPFTLVDMAPETTFCVYKNDVFKQKMLGVSYIKRSDGTVKYSAYTKTHRFELDGGSLTDGVTLVETTTNGIEEIPIVEYRMPEGMGVFEKAVALMDAYNTATSNRIDDIEQFVQSILAIFGVDLDAEALDKLKKSLCLIVPDIMEGTQPRAEYLVNSLDQTSVQAAMDDLYYHILEVCSVPGREQSSGGNTGAATEMGAGGWRKVQFSAQRIIAAWQKGDRDMYRVALAILKKSRKAPAELKNLKITDLESKFTLSKNNNLLSKAQALNTMIQCGVAPRIAIREVDLFADAESTYEESKPYIEKALDRMAGTGNSEETNEKKKTGDISNQPKGDDALASSVQKKAVTQKPD